jgi:ribonuclease HI
MNFDRLIHSGYRPRITVYTDGSCDTNTRAGGWGCILRSKNGRMEMYGSVSDTTNNQMELTAVIEALNALKEPCIVNVHTDSQYVITGSKFVFYWRDRGWLKKDGNPVSNIELWETYLEAIRPHAVMFKWVRGHATNRFNNRCDQLAVAARKGKLNMADKVFIQNKPFVK